MREEGSNWAAHYVYLGQGQLLKNGCIQTNAGKRTVGVLEKERAHTVFLNGILLSMEEIPEQKTPNQLLSHWIEQQERDKAKTIAQLLEQTPGTRFSSKGTIYLIECDLVQLKFNLKSNIRKIT